MKEIFSRLNCSDTQAKLYMLLSQVGPSIASMLSKRSKLKRVTVYGALEGLVEKNLVQTYKKNKVTYYQACDPDLIEKVLREQLEDEQRFNKRALREIKKLKEVRKDAPSEVIEVKGVMSYYEGQDAVKSLIQESLNLPHKRQYCIGMNGYNVLNIAGDWKKYIKARVKKGMKVDSIQADTTFGREYQSRDKRELRETTLIPADLVPEQGELNIIGDHIILYSSEGDEAIGLKITNKKIAKTLQKLFKLAWDQSKTLAKKKK